MRDDTSHPRDFPIRLSAEFLSETLSLKAVNRCIKNTEEIEPANQEPSKSGGGSSDPAQRGDELAAEASCAFSPWNPCEGEERNYHKGALTSTWMPWCVCPCTMTHRIIKFFLNEEIKMFSDKLKQELITIIPTIQEVSRELWCLIEILNPDWKNTAP